MIERHILVINFDEIGVSVDSEILDFCEKLCNRYGLSESDLVDEWMAFTISNKEDMQISPEGLALMERKCLKKKMGISNRYKGESTSASRISDEIIEQNISVCYQNDPKELVQHPATPVSDRVKNIRNTAVPSPRSLFSPTSYSPIGSTRNKKYDDRINAGEVLCSLNENIDGLSWKTNSYLPQTIQMSTEFSEVPYDVKAAYEKSFSRIQVSRKWADSLSIDLCKNNLRKVPEEPIGIANETTTFTGKIVCDSNGKLNTSSILLEGSLANKIGKLFPLQVTDVSECALFPGQVVAIDGRNPTGGKIVAEKIFSDVKLSKCSEPKEFQVPREPLQLVVSAGPYTLSDSLCYEPLSDLLKYVLENKPHVVIFIGPIVDSAHAKIADDSYDFTFSELFRKVLTDFLDGIKSAGKMHTKVIVMSHYREAGQRNLYPTPCPRIPDIKKKFDYPNLHFVPDPSVLNISGVTVGITGADILMHLGKEELFCGSSTDRLRRLASHLLQQKSFYPLLPPSEEMTIDLGLLTAHAQIPFIPHIMILPSEMRHFIKCIKGCVVINPERLTKGMVGGSFTKIQVRSVVEDELWMPETHISAQVVKI